MNLFIVILFLLSLLILPCCATEGRDTIEFPTMTIISKKNQLFLYDTIPSKIEFAKVSGIAVRSLGMGMPNYLSILGASIYGTKVTYDGVEWNDPRTNLSNLNELPYWRYQTLTVEVMEKSMVQGGEVIVIPQNPTSLSGIELNQSFLSNGTRKLSGIVSTGKKGSVGIGFQSEQKAKGKYPNINSNERQSYSGFSSSSFYAIHSFTVRKIPIQLQWFTYHHQNDLPGLVGRAIESETRYSKKQFRTILSTNKPIGISLAYVFDKVFFKKPQWQYSPNGFIPFTPYHEESNRRGLEFNLSISKKKNENTYWKGLLNLQNDRILFYDDYLPVDQRKNYTNRFVVAIENDVVLNQNVNNYTFTHKLQLKSLHAYWQPLSKSFSSLYPSYLFQWNPLPQVVQKNRIGIAYRLPSVQELFLTQTIFSKGNPNLVPEESKEIQSEIQYRFHNLISTSLLGYYRMIDNGIVWRRNSRGQYTTYNLAKIQSIGGILTNSIVINKSFTVNQSISITNTKNNDRSDINYQNQLPLIPKYQISTRINYHSNIYFKPRIYLNHYYQSRRYFLESNTEFRYQSKNRLPEETIFDLFIELHPFQRMNENLNPYYVRVGVQNLFNQESWWMEGVPNHGRIWMIEFKWDHLREE